MLSVTIQGDQIVEAKFLRFRETGRQGDAIISEPVTGAGVVA